MLLVNLPIKITTLHKEIHILPGYHLKKFLSYIHAILVAVMKCVRKCLCGTNMPWFEVFCCPF